MAATKEQRLAAAIAEAKRFIERGEEYLTALRIGDVSSMNGCRESGAVRRASMDLTRSLADYRKPF